jgi:hypothetical protein
MLLAYDFQDENLVFQVTKALDQGFNLYKDAYPAMANWERSKAIVPGLPVPFHKGAMRYFKEIGLWNQKFEEVQKARLERQEKLAAAWASAVSEAKQKQVKTADFPAFWLKKREALK